MIGTAIYGPGSFERKEEFQPIVDAIMNYDENNYEVRFRGYKFLIHDGGIGVSLRYANEPLPEFLKGLKPLRVTIYDSLRNVWGDKKIESGLYELGQSSAHVETIVMNDGSMETRIHIESRSVKSAISLFRKIRAKEIEPKEAWVSAD